MDTSKRMWIATAVGAMVCIGAGVSVGIYIGTRLSTERSWTDMVQAYSSMATAVTGLLSVALWGAYVVLTRETLVQIQRQAGELERQTELQIAAYLVITAETVSRDQCPDVGEIDPGMQALHTKWHDLLTANLPAAMVSADRYIRLKIKNRGKSDVMSWKLSVRAVITSSQLLVEKGLTIGEPPYEWAIDRKHIIEPGSDVYVTIAPVGVFPLIDCSWSLTYEDSRGKESDRCGGDFARSERNLIAAPKV